MKQSNTVEEEANNLLAFPKEAITRLYPSGTTSENEGNIEIKKLLILKHQIIREYLSLLVPPLFNAFFMAGFDMSKVNESKDAAMIVESIKSFLEKQMKIQHPMQILSEKLFDKDEESEMLQFTGEIYVVEEKGKEEEEDATGNE